MVFTLELEEISCVFSGVNSNSFNVTFKCLYQIGSIIFHVQSLESSYCYHHPLHYFQLKK